MLKKRYKLTVFARRLNYAWILIILIDFSNKEVDRPGPKPPLIHSMGWHVILRVITLWNQYSSTSLLDETLSNFEKKSY